MASGLAGKFGGRLFLAFIIGTSLVIACGCVINNYLDRELDRKMARTRRRSLATGRIRPLPAIIYGVVLGIIGFWLLLIYVNRLTAGIGAIGLFFYLVMYSIGKRRSSWGTVIGSVSGATPIAAGYTAVTNRFDTAALLLFLTMVCWQMPHFYAIAMYRFKDYQAAGLPVLPVQKGLRRTKIEILVYIAAFTVCAVLLTVFGYTGYAYLIVVLALGGSWFVKGLRGFRTTDDKQWGRRMFLFSLIVLLALSVSLSLSAFLPKFAYTGVMIVLLHVTIALLSLVSVTYTLLAPSAAKLRVSYGLTAATFVSGTYLIVSTHSSLVSACLAGLFYLSVIATMLAVAHRRLVSATK